MCRCPVVSRICTFLVVDDESFTTSGYCTLSPLFSTTTPESLKEGCSISGPWRAEHPRMCGHPAVTLMGKGHKAGREEKEG